jgi:hypothetical protein
LVSTTDKNFTPNFSIGLITSRSPIFSPAGRSFSAPSAQFNYGVPIIIPYNYSLQDFKYGLMFRTGYRWINVFVTYDITPLFKENKGPELTPLTFGFTLMRF